MTPAELQHEYTVTVETRLGELCGTNRPTPEQLKQARDEANRHVGEIEMHKDFQEWSERQETKGNQ